MMSKNRIDLSPLDPTIDKNRFDVVVKKLTRNILSARRISTVSVLFGAFIPLMATALMVLMTAMSLFFMYAGKSGNSQQKVKTLTFAKWVQGEKRSTVWKEVQMIKVRK
jgi:hypothetical protein